MAASPPLHRRTGPRWATLLLLVGVVVTSVHARTLQRAPPTTPSPGGPVLGIETVILPGATALAWRGPFGRAARVEGEGRFEVWRAPLWSGRPTELRAEDADIAAATFVVDHPLNAGESVAAAWAAAPLLYGIGFVALLGGMLFDGAVWHATVLALLLGGVRALSPAWGLDSDPARYWQSALDILAGGLPDPLWPPAWALALVPAAAWGDPVAGRLFGVALFGICPALAARVSGPGRAGVAAAVLTAASFEGVGFAPSLYSETLFVTLGLAFLAVPGSLPGGLLAAAGALTRVHALLVFPLVAWARGGLTRMLFVLLVPVVLWSAVVSAGEGRMILISDNGGMNLWIGHRPGADGDWHEPGPPPLEGYGPAALAAIRADPAAAMRRVVGNVGRLWNASRSDRTLATRPLGLPLVPFVVLVLLAVVGGWAPRRGVPSTGALVMWLVATTMVTAVFFAPVRYKLGLYPALLPLGGRGLGFLIERAGAAVRRGVTVRG